MPLLGDRLEHRHQQLLMVGGDIGPLEHRRDSNWPGATSLCRVLAGMPSLKSSRSERDHLRQVVVAEQRGCARRVLIACRLRSSGVL
jgi:hypothetical protein